MFGAAPRAAVWFPQQHSLISVCSLQPVILAPSLAYGSCPRESYSLQECPALRGRRWEDSAAGMTAQLSTHLPPSSNSPNCPSAHQPPAGTQSPGGALAGSAAHRPPSCWLSCSGYRCVFRAWSCMLGHGLGHQWTGHFHSEHVA